MSVPSNGVATSGCWALEMELVLLRKWMFNFILINLDASLNGYIWLVATVLDNTFLENLEWIHHLLLEELE